MSSQRVKLGVSIGNSDDSGTPNGGFSPNVHDDIRLFFRRLGELNHLPDLLSAYQTLINGRDCPRAVHVAIRHTAMLEPMLLLSACSVTLVW